MKITDSKFTITISLFSVDYKKMKKDWDIPFFNHIKIK